MRALLLIAAACMTLGAAAPVSARVKVNYQTASRGFSDRTPATPVGGNAGTTLGEQRRIAFRHALGLWEARLDGEVPIELDVSFDALGCENGAVVLGQAANLSWFSGLEAPGANAALLYPSALANQLMGEDLVPGRPDIVMGFNLSVDGECRDYTDGFYYGLDSKSGEQADFVHVVLHELAHGLGITSALDPDTGAVEMEGATGVDVYSAHLRDLDRDRLWGELSSAERKESMQNVRRVVWDGPRTSARVETELGRGEPALSFEPVPAGFSGVIADSNAGSLPLNGPVSGEVYAVRGCNMPEQVGAGFVLLFPRRCRIDMESLASVVRDSRAAGALLTGTGLAQSPPFPIDAVMQRSAAAAPVYVLSEMDARAVVSALEQGELTARLSADAKRATGADAQHRPLVYISRPHAPGSSIAHLEPLLRPDQLMEPATGVLPSHNLALTIAMLADMGWSARCGDGTMSAGEDCDEGARNSDHAADSCRSDCTRPRCGDAVRDKGEGCDEGSANRDDLANACRSDCRKAHCGDGVLDKGEQCDQGKDNGATSGCRSNCTIPRCGDGVLDAREACDEGMNNSNTRAGACRLDCSAARCGDSVVDEGEACDEGPSNSASRPDACRADCSMARCGDGVRDAREACDDGADNSDALADACRLDCSLARCGDGVVDAEEICDGTSDCDARCWPKKPPTPEPTANADAGGCGCRIASHTSSARGVRAVASLLLLLGLVRVRRSRCRQRRNGRPTEPSAQVAAASRAAHLPQKPAV